MKVLCSIARKTAIAIGACAFLFCAASAEAFDPCADAAHYLPLEQRYTKGLLFKVQKCGSPASYLFGTVHLTRPEVFHAAGSAFLKLDEVQAAGFELVEPEGEIAAWFENFIRTPDSKYALSILIGKDYFEKLVKELQTAAATKGRIIRADALEKFRPWAAAVAVETIDEDQGTVLDEKLKGVALWLKKPVFGLETLSEQSEVFNNMPQEMQIHMLKDTIDHFDDVRSAKADLIKAYIAQDAKQIEALEEQSIVMSDDKEFDSIMMDRLITKRNRIMEQRLLPRLAKQSVLVAVGVAHLMGQQGILHLLEKDGYFITPEP